ARVLVEKLVSRRNSLLKLFSVDGPALPYDPKLTISPSVKDGKIIQQDWPGYASRFAFGDPESPLHGLKWYILSVAESSAMENLIGLANEQLPAINAQEAQIAHNQSLFTSAIDQYLSTGTIQKVPFGFWTAPFVSGGFHVGRDAIIGNYLGTNNLVQLVDS